MNRFLLIIFLVPAAVQAEGVLHITSEAGDTVGQGQTKEISFGDEIIVTRLAEGIRFHLPPPAVDRFSLEFRAPQGDDLRTACFEKSQRSPFRDPDRTGLAFSLVSRGCNSVIGRYRVLDIQTDGQTDDITSLAIDFVQHCEGKGPALFGKLRYNSTVPTTEPHIAPAFDLAGELSYDAAAGAIGGGASGASRTIPLNRLNLRAGRNFDNGVGLAFSGEIPGVGTNAFWRLELAAPDEATLTAGSYPLAQRFPIQDPGHPGLDFSFYGSGCNNLLGEFEVSLVAYEQWDELPRGLFATFNQRCGEQGAGPLTSGDVDLVVTYREPDGLFIDGFEGARLPHPVWECQ